MLANWKTHDPMAVFPFVLPTHHEGERHEKRIQTYHKGVYMNRETLQRLL